MAYKLRVKTLTVTTAGIPVAGPDFKTKKVQIVAPASNAGAVYYGSKGLTAGLWRALAAGASDPHEAPDGGDLDLSALRFDAANSGDQVTLLYYEWEEQADAEYLLPAQVSGLTTWWKADAITGLSNNQSVVNWPDSSGNGNLLGGGGARYQTNVQNGLPGVLFDGVDNGTDRTLTVGNYTLFWAMNLTYGGCLWWAEGSTDEDFLLDNEEDAAVYVTRNNQSKIAAAFAPGWLTGPKLVVLRVGAKVGDLLVRTNGAPAPHSLSTALDPGSQAQSRTFWVGYRDGDSPIAGHLLEGAFFNSALPLAVIEQLEVYFNDKWALY